MMNEENHLGWKLVSGVRRDVVNLFKDFGDTKSVRFEDFCGVWKRMNFSLVFSNRISFAELLEFTEEILLIVKEYLSSIYEFHTRIAALYTLYGLYFKQPIIGGAKIRFTKTEWEEFYALIENSKAGGHYDIAFIFIKLYISGAFSFTATIREAGLERGFRKYFEKRTFLYSKAFDLELLYRPLISEDLVASLVKLEALYCKKKSELLGNKNLVFIDGKFAESLQEELENYKIAAQNQTKPIQSKVIDTVESSPEDTRQTETQSITPEEGSSQSTVPSSLKGRRKAHLTANEDPDGGSGSKKKRLIKRYEKQLAKKKAEYYIAKLKAESNSEADESLPGLQALLDFDSFKSENL